MFPIGSKKHDSEKGLKVFRVYNSWTAQNKVLRLWISVGEQNLPNINEKPSESLFFEQTIESLNNWIISLALHHTSSDL